MSLLIHKRPSKLLSLKGSKLFLFEVDYLLITQEIERIAEGKDETEREKIEKIKEWKKNVT